MLSLLCYRRSSGCLAVVSRFRCGDHHGRISRGHEQDVGHQSWAEVSLHSLHRVRRLEPGGLPPLVPQESNLDVKTASEDIRGNYLWHSWIILKHPLRMFCLWFCAVACNYCVGLMLPLGSTMDLAALLCVYIYPITVFLSVTHSALSLCLFTHNSVLP